ncbi:glycosyl hydrolase family 18 protein [Isoptericola sp. b515]|uniref:glycosyl hydrolase family 18 protein n=1 Tax=Isoptericola sp. b515 TaxID=3064652 RepID=UPI0027134E24|nr:glycosyl hydrolase family 18 protein [Isoptericola sp. b515]MDO8149255.1 glycosyl hydrolase family 18 protein [Isoptericola sp. b515]
MRATHPAPRRLGAAGAAVVLLATTLAAATSTGAATAAVACEPSWTAESVYTAGDVASFAGENWTAGWWTQGEEPGSAEWGPWTSDGACGATGPGPEPTPEPTDEPGPEPTPTAEPSPEPTGEPTADPGEPISTNPDDVCRPDGMKPTAGVDTPYCDVYDTDGREILPNGLDRRVIGYFTSWRTGGNDQPSYFASDIPWGKVSHVNYAFAHVGPDNRVSVNEDVPGNPATDATWPGQEMDPALPYTGHFNQLAQYKAANPGVKVIPAVGGWAETGGYFDGDGNRVASGGFYTMTETQEGIDTFADSVVDFIRTYGFDGIDIDYEYPTSNTNAGNPDDFAFSDARRGELFSGYVDLMRTVREKLDVAGAEDGEYYLLTTASPSSGWLLRGMEAHQVVQYLDYVNLMSYDLHGAWNEYVGGNSPLFDGGDDPELAAGGVYTAYDGIGYLNGDWAAHYFRGAMQSGRINLGVGFYTRGFQDVQGGTYGDGGTAPAPAGFDCPAGTNGSCGYGADGIDNLWYDTDPQGNAIPAGVNPIWHALNLEDGVVGDYAASYGVPTTIEGTHTRHVDEVTKNEWWWNETTRTYLSGDTTWAIGEKADHVVDSGLGGMMIWELAGDYAYDEAAGQYGIGSTLVDLMHAKLSGVAPYGATKANADRPMPDRALDLSIDYTEFALGDNNYPIAPKVVLTNHGATDVPAGATISFQYGTSDLGEMSDWSGFGTTTTRQGHTGDNVGGLTGDFHDAEFTVPAGGIPAGGSITNNLTWTLPIAQLSNVVVTVDGTDYATTYDQPRGVTVVDLPAGSGGSGGGDDGGGAADGTACEAPAWQTGGTYTGGDAVTHAGHAWTAKWWTRAEPTASADAWTDEGTC